MTRQGPMEGSGQRRGLRPLWLQGWGAGTVRHQGGAEPASQPPFSQAPPGATFAPLSQWGTRQQEGQHFLIQEQEEGGAQLGRVVPISQGTTPLPQPQPPEGPCLVTGCFLPPSLAPSQAHQPAAPWARFSPEAFAHAVPSACNAVPPEVYPALFLQGPVSHTLSVRPVLSTLTSQALWSPGPLTSLPHFICIPKSV